jgi:hypothetical protein
MLAPRSKSSNSGFVQGADANLASALLRFLFSAVCTGLALDDKKERSTQVKAQFALNQASEMLSFVF